LAERSSLSENDIAWIGIVRDELIGLLLSYKNKAIVVEGALVGQISSADDGNTFVDIVAGCQL